MTSTPLPPSPPPRPSSDSDDNSDPLSDTHNSSPSTPGFPVHYQHNSYGSTITPSTVSHLDVSIPLSFSPTSSDSDETYASRSSSSLQSASSSSEKKKKYSLPSPTCPPFVVHPPSHTPEHFRDFDGPFTLYRSVLLLWMFFVMGSLFKLQDLFWPPDPIGSEFTDEWYAETRVGYILLLPLLSTILAFIGALWFRFDAKLDDIKPISHKVVFRIVSRGINNECLMETIRKCQAVMRRNSFFPYLIEIVTDADVFQAPPDPDVLHLKVPIDYKTPKNTKFKARALHYACIASLVPSDAWICHLDEETQPTSSAVKGIAKFVAECERNQDRKRIGQGCILYHRSWKDYRFLTLADMRRTGDDFGHFYLQHRLGVTLFGLHGAFIVCRADAEKQVGFDLGPDGSITEDAWWALLALEKGCRFAWVEGFLAEQSTQSVSDLIKQRRRWNYGLMKVAFLNPARLRYRVAFMFFLLNWFISPFFTPLQIAYVIIIIAHDLPIPMVVRIPTLFIIAVQVWTYFIGWVINVREGLPVKRYMIPFWTIIIILLYPVFQIFEVAALISSFFAGWTKSGRGFHVVQKSATTAKQTLEQKSLLV